MTLHRVLNMAMVAFTALAWIYLLGYSYANDEEAEAKHSRAYVGRTICGEEGIPQWKGDELTCRTHRNHVASRQIVAEAK